MKLSGPLQKLLANRDGKKVVFTNGCFDILHIGHLTYLNEAKALGQILV
ncbi:MAG: adenylyltransferase/cytidyltransferase family protein, partial [Halobacteriovoraceae bacterium]|nr:adenylyltransferase/cytidyltransferase family protein [Halobacteriovoraceae bacterium]